MPVSRALKDFEQSMQKGVRKIARSSPAIAAGEGIAKVGDTVMKAGSSAHRKIAAKFPSVHKAHKTATRKIKKALK